ncbi:MAG: DinB family protein [Ignavibacteriaceae bacterium]
MKYVLLLLVVLYSPFYLLAQQEEEASGIFSDIFAEIEFVQGQVVKLAGAIPEDKYGWRPAEDVRSVSEVFMHIGEANYFLSTFFGGSMPEGYTRELTTTITKRSEVIDFINKSYSYTRDILTKVKEEDLEKPVDFFGNKSNIRRMILTILFHSHEHLGQAVAYARMNNVVPPWSAGK